MLVDKTIAESVYPATLSFFVALLNDETFRVDTLTLVAKRKKKINEYFVCQPEQVIFTLETVFYCLSPAVELSFNQFRRMIYQSQLNTDLASHGGKIITYPQLGERHLFSLIAI